MTRTIIYAQRKSPQYLSSGRYSNSNGMLGFAVILEQAGTVAHTKDEVRQA